jgi:hypothetical protein
VSEQPPSAPQGKSNTPLILALVGAAAAGGAYYYYGATSTPTEAAKELGTQVDSARAVAENKLGLKRSKDDYQKVYNRIAETLEKDDYDGEFGRCRSRVPSATEDVLTELVTRLRWFPRPGRRPSRLALVWYLRCKCCRAPQPPLARSNMATFAIFSPYTEGFQHRWLVGII